MHKVQGAAHVVDLADRSLAQDDLAPEIGVDGCEAGCGHSRQRSAICQLHVHQPGDRRHRCCLQSGRRLLSQIDSFQSLTKPNYSLIASREIGQRWTCIDDGFFKLSCSMLLLDSSEVSAVRPLLGSSWTSIIARQRHCQLCIIAPCLSSTPWSSGALACPRASLSEATMSPGARLRSTTTKSSVRGISMRTGMPSAARRLSIQPTFRGHRVCSESRDRLAGFSKAVSVCTTPVRVRRECPCGG